MGHGDYLEIANMQVLKISDADDFMIVVIILISTLHTWSNDIQSS